MKPEPSAWPVEVPVVELVDVPADVSVELPVCDAVVEDDSDPPLLVAKDSPELSGGPIGSTDPHPTASTRVSVQRIGATVTGPL